MNKKELLKIKYLYKREKLQGILEVVLTSFGTIRNYIFIKFDSNRVILAQSTRVIYTISSHNYIFKNIYRFALLKLFRFYQIPALLESAKTGR